MTAWFLTWLWQGTALALALSMALHFLPRVNAATRCAIWWGALLALVWLGWQTSPQIASEIAGRISATGPPTAGETLAIRVSPMPARLLTVVTMTWATIALFRLLQILPGLHLLYRLKQQCRRFPSEVELPLWLESKGTGRPARLMLCDRIAGAAVLGLHDPYIAIPPELVDELSATDLDQIILHEYGHIQRRDDWTRLLQVLLESALWIHPAAFLIGRELNLEREVACDDWVISRSRAPRSYAACLFRATECRRGRVSPEFAPALFDHRRDLVRRIDRVLDPRRNARQRASWLTILAGVGVLAVFAVHLRALPLVTESFESMASLESVTMAVSAPERTASLLEPAQRQEASGLVNARRQVKMGRATDDRPEEEVAEELPAITESIPADVPAPPAIVPEVEEIPLLAGGRSFQGVDAPAALPSGGEAHGVFSWQPARTAGVGIAVAGRRAGLGVANAFTKMGAAVARRF